jgi:hypothetical protein
MSETKRVSLKDIKPMLEAITPLAAEIRKNVENMPNGTKRKSLLVTLEALDKKISVSVKEVSESAVMEYVNKHPEVLQKLAHFAASDKGAVEIGTEVTQGIDVNEQNQKKKSGKKH